MHLDAVSETRARASEHPDLSLSRPALFVVCLSVYLVVLVVLNKTAEASLSLFSCKSVFTWSTFSCARGPHPPVQQRANRYKPKIQCERRHKSRWKTTRQMLLLLLPSYACCNNSLFLSRDENTITRPMTLLVFRFLLFDFFFPFFACSPKLGARSWKWWSSDHARLCHLSWCGLFSQNETSPYYNILMFWKGETRT